MLGRLMGTQDEATVDGPNREVAAECAGPSTKQHDNFNPTQDATPLTVIQPSEELPVTSDSNKSTEEADFSTEPSLEKLTATASLSHASSSDHLEEKDATNQQTYRNTTVEDDDAEFVPPDVEHIVSTGAAQEGTLSMQTLRDLVAQARATTGQPRETLPPGFDDDEPEASISTSAQSRGEKRKAEAEPEILNQSSSGIEEVKAAAEKSQLPETRNLLHKAISSISGLVSRRAKTESIATVSTTTTSDKQGEEEDVELPKDDKEADESDDDGSSSDSGSSSSVSSDDEGDETEDRKVGAALLGEEDDDEEGGEFSTAPVTKNEILAPDVEQPSIQELTAEEKQTLRKLGRVHSIVDSVVVVEQDVQKSSHADAARANNGAIPIDSTGRQGERQGEYSVLDTGSLLCFEDGKVLGLVFETFGSIHNPMYSIRFASATAIDRNLISAGKEVYYLPKQSTYVLTQLLRSMKGSDASNMWDEEVAEDEIDYSDDEQEAEAKRRAKAIRSGKVDDQGNPLVTSSARANKRQKQQQGSGQSSQPPPRLSANGSFHQRSGQHSSQSRSINSAPTSLPRRAGGAANLPLPPAPAGPASLGPAFPHGIASLPPRPSAGLPSKPTLTNEASKAFDSNDFESPAGPRSRTGTAEGSVSGLTHSRMSSAPASSLPAKPVHAVAAVASGPATPKISTAATSPYRSPASVVGASSPPHASRVASMRIVAPMSTGAYPHQGSAGQYAGAAVAPSSMPASPAAPSRHANEHGSAYSPGVGAPLSVQGGGHFNPAYMAHWQHPYSPAPTAATHAHYVAANTVWNRPQSYQPPPLHMTPGVASQQPYASYASSHAGYGAPSGASGASWNAQSYPGSHYPGYTDREYYASAANAAVSGAGAGHASQHHYAPAQAFAYGSHSNVGANADPYNGYTYTPPTAHAASTGSTVASSAAPDSYDPRSPLMCGNSTDPNQHAASGSTHAQGP